MTLVKGYCQDGDIFARRGAPKTVNKYIRATKHCQLKCTDESKIPPLTRKIKITLKKPFAPATFALYLERNEVPVIRPFKLIPTRSLLTEVVDLGADGKVEGRVEGYQFDYNLEISLDEASLEILDNPGFNWMIDVSFNSFNFTREMEENVNQAFISFCCSDARNVMISDFVNLKVWPFK